MGNTNPDISSIPFRRGTKHLKDLDSDDPRLIPLQSSSWHPPEDSLPWQIEPEVISYPTDPALVDYLNGLSMWELINFMPEDFPVTLSASAQELRPVSWMWENMIPLGFVSTLVGLDKVGKSSLLYCLAGLLSRGMLPGNLMGSKEATLISSVEDPVAQVLIPRLTAVEADLDLIHILKLGDGLSDIILPDHLDHLWDTAVRIRPRLIILDPAPAHMSGGLSANDSKDVRHVFSPLARLAEKIEAAVVLVVHVNKGSSTTARNRLSGSAAFSDLARSVLTAGPIPGEEGVYGVVAKGNLTRSSTGWGYRLEESTVKGASGRRFGASRAVLTEMRELTEAELLTANGGRRPDLKALAARTIILAKLGENGGKDKRWSEIQEGLDRAGISQTTGNRVRSELLETGGIVKVGATRNVTWKLPS